jgi:hypothetical protein
MSTVIPFDLDNQKRCEPFILWNDARCAPMPGSAQIVLELISFVSSLNGHVVLVWLDCVIKLLAQLSDL